jgi:uncharacterized protein
MKMGSTKIWANLAVKDLERTTKFYTALGFKLNGVSKELTSFAFGEENFVINFFLKKELEKFLPGIADTSNGNEIIFTLSAKDKEEVDEWAESVLSAGGDILREPAKYEQGYTFIFSDPDGHKFNVLYWPGM